jgi:GMP reductase
MRIERDIKLDYCDVLFRPKRSTMGSRKDVSLERTYTFRNSKHTYTGLPIMAANMDGVGTTSMATTLSKFDLFTVLNKSYSAKDINQWMNSKDWNPELLKNISVSTGITPADKENINKVLELNPGIGFVCIDVANGYSEKFIDYVAEFRDKYPHITIIAGNVVTPDVTEELILRGADIVKVGIGPGSVCTTRIKTGVGYPQLSAVIECADAAHGLGGHIIADGGCTCPGDVAKAFGAGADFVMLGGMLAGCDEGGGEVLDGKIQFYGMSSKAAQEKNGNGFKDYRSSEGRVVQVRYRGSVEPIVADLLGGIRSTCTYVGAISLKELSKRTTFIQVNNGRQYNNTYEQHTVGE